MFDFNWPLVLVCISNLLTLIMLAQHRLRIDGAEESIKSLQNALRGFTGDE